MKYSLLVILIYVVATGPAIAQREVGIPCTKLCSYLKRVKPHKTQETEALCIVNRAQLIYLHYKHPEPSYESVEFAFSIKASVVVPISHHTNDGIYSEIRLVFSRLFGDSRNASAAQWIEEMKRPFSKGYSLSSVRVIPKPTEEIKKTTTNLVSGIFHDCVAYLETLKIDFPSLQSFTPSTVQKNHLYFAYGLGPATKAGHKKIKNDWFKVRFWIAPITGSLRQQPIIARRTYILQATEACWRVESANLKLKKKVTVRIMELLKSLDDYEKQLSRKEDGRTTKFTLSPEDALSDPPNKK